MGTRTCTTPECGRPHRARGYCGSCYNQHFPNPNPQAPVPCTVCGAMVMKDKRDHAKRQPVCSVMCRTFLLTGHWPMCMVGDRPPTRRELAEAKLARSLPPLRKRWYAGFCIECGDAFVHDQPQTNTCSARCARRLGHSRRRALKVGAFVAPVYRRKIFQRDRWRCQLCRKLVARTKVVPHPKAPVLDHIIPLARGGMHEPANVQCAHFICNSVKSDSAANDQLLLFG